MNHPIDCPFESHAWANVDLELALLLSKKTERILVGSRYAIHAQLKTFAGRNSSPNPSVLNSRHDDTAEEKWEHIIERKGRPKSQPFFGL